MDFKWHSLIRATPILNKRPVLTEGDAPFLDVNFLLICVALECRKKSFLSILMCSIWLRLALQAVLRINYSVNYPACLGDFDNGRNEELSGIMDDT